MPNQLSIPFKKTTDVPLKVAVRRYILEKHNDTHPDAFKWDINEWDSLRRASLGGMGTDVHVDRVQRLQIYHAQLVFILVKLPPDIGLDIPYYPAFFPSSPSIILRNLVYERAAVLFNLAALYSQLANAEDRSTPAGLKQAIAHYQSAAGTLSYLSSVAIPKLRSSVSAETMPLELSELFLAHLESLMLAQAQECVWQRAVMDNYKNGTIAKLAKKVSSFYETSLTQVRSSTPQIKHLLPTGWIPHLEAKHLHFEAAAQVRKGIDDLEARRYGHEVARLSLAQTVAQKGYEVARRGGVALAVVNDIKSVLDNVQKNLARAERDNDLIYHQDVPSPSSLPPIQGTSMVQALAKDLAEPKAVIGSGAVIFSGLLGWGAKRAMEIYGDRRQNWIRDEVVDRSQRLDDVVTETLRSLNLPASLEALEKPAGIPPSLLKKAEEVRLEKGPERVQSLLEGVQKLAQRDMNILSEAMDILDQEAEEDEQFQEDYPIPRLPSHEANQELTSKEQRYRAILQQAAESDEIVRVKWDEWEPNIIGLTWDEAELEASIPSPVTRPSARQSRIPNSTQTHVRALRVALEGLNDVQRVRREQVARATRLAEAEDITPRILKAASGFEQWVEVQPAMLEDVLEEEMGKYEKFSVTILEGETKQEALLEKIKERNELFLQSRKDDPAMKDREYALQSLDLAYHKYKEITRNLDEGLKFYNDFATILTQFRESCREWVNIRRNEMHQLTESMANMSLSTAPPSVLPSEPEQSTPRLPPTAPPQLNVGFDLPPPDSDEWESAELPPAPVKGNRKPQVTSKSRR